MRCNEPRERKTIVMARRAFPKLQDVQRAGPNAKSHGRGKNACSTTQTGPHAPTDPLAAGGVSVALPLACTRCISPSTARRQRGG